MPAGMPGMYPGYQANAIAASCKTQAEIDVFEPDGLKAFIKPADAPPGLPPDQQKCAGRLLDIRGLIQDQVQAAVVPVDGVPGEEPVQPESLEGQGRGRGKAPDGKAGLHRTIGILEYTGNGAHVGLRQFGNQGSDPIQ